MNPSYCDFSNDEGLCCNSIPEYLIDTNGVKMYVCKLHFWHLHDPDSGDEYYCLNNPPEEVRNDKNRKNNRMGKMERPLR